MTVAHSSDSSQRALDMRHAAARNPWIGRARVDTASLVVCQPKTIQNAPVVAGTDRFLIAKNPDDASSLKYLVRLPLDGGVILKVRDTWPKTARVYCHPFDGAWPDPAELVDDVPVLSCRRRGPAIDLVLDRPRQDRSQFVFTEGAVAR